MLGGEGMNRSEGIVGEMHTSFMTKIARYVGSDVSSCSLQIK